MKITNVLGKINSYISSKLLFFVAIITVLFVLFNSRQIFFFRYEPEYYENLYYHSQWNIPNSARGISDGVLYQFVGYRLVQGENPFNLNFEAPPFGKYLYGLSEYFLGNPYWISLGLYLGSIVFFYYLTKEIFKDKKYSLAILVLFVTTPFIATQLRETMLDLPVTFLFLVYTYFFVKFLKEPKPKLLILSGIFLGLATGTKIGVYTPSLIILSLSLILWVKRNILFPGLFIIAGGIGYLISYISYFLKHPNPIPWLKLHQKQLDFYYNPESQVDHLNQWRGIFLNTYEGWWNLGKTSLGDWSPFLPVGVIAAFLVFILALKRKEKIWVFISGSTLNFLIINTFISFWPRYLMPIIPTLVLLIAYFGRKYMIILLVFALLNLPILGATLSTKNYTASALGVGDFVAKRAYRELYRSIDPAQREAMPETEFIKTLEEFYETLGVRKIDVVLKSTNHRNEKIEAIYQVNYLTDYGQVNFEQVLKYQDINNLTRLIWSWDYLWPGYTPEATLTVEKIDLEEVFYQPLDKVYHERGQAELVYIITRHINWPDTLDHLSKLVERKSSLDIYEQMRWTIPDDFPRYVGTLNKGLGEEGRKEVADIKGVKLKEINYDKGVNIYFEKDGVKNYIIKTDGEKVGIAIID